MNRGKKEPCRNFMRGSCHYGDRCKFSHSFNTQQQQQQQQQQPANIRNSNPFGFGAYAQQPKGVSSGFASVPTKQQNQFKPFENKWSRTAPDTTTSPFAKQSNNQQPKGAAGAAAASHTCTDPEACKRIIVEDFEKERPLWKLTCYAHFKNLPCDIVGDISYEELRAVAYDDAKKGLNLMSVVERERNMLNSKLVEFDNFQRSPTPFRSTATPATVNVPPSVSSFSQLGMSVNQGSNNASFGFGQQPQQSPFSFPSQTSQAKPQPQQSPSPASNFATQGLFGNQQQMHGNIPFATVNIPSADTMGKIQYDGDMRIWSKDSWEPGEIPEDAPPEEVCF